MGLKVFSFAHDTASVSFLCVLSLQFLSLTLTHEIQAAILVLSAYIVNDLHVLMTLPGVSLAESEDAS